VVLSKLDSSTLEQLANETGGTYRDASRWIDLAAVLQQTVEAGRKGAFAEKRTASYIDRFQWVLAPAVLCLLLSFWREFPVRPRPRTLALALESGNRKAETGKMLTTAVAVLVVLSTLRFPLSAFASEDTDVYAAPLAKTVQRLAAQERYAPNDWAELARQTITWGQRQQEAKQPVAEGPVHDGLAAVATGEKLDAKAADWAQLRRDLEALLQKSDQPPQPQQQPQKQPQKNQSDQNQQPQQQPQSQDQSGNEQKSPPPQSSNSEKQDSKNEDRKPPESAFGGLQKESKPNEPPSSSEMQKVGGAEKKEAPANLDPALTLPLQKLEQLKDNDSPARLFQIMEGEKKPTPAQKGKDW
jgi:Ca-activated chloride channel family protein